MVDRDSWEHSYSSVMRCVSCHSRHVEIESIGRPTLITNVGWSGAAVTKPAAAATAA